jgi:hypothetical protein
MMPAYVLLNSNDLNEETTKEIPKKKDRLDYTGAWQE